jgi:hypothetical protein
VLTTAWLLPDVWNVVAQYLVQKGLPRRISHLSFLDLICLVFHCVAELSTVQLCGEPVKAHGVASTPSGLLIVVTRENRLYSVEPASGLCERMECYDSWSKSNEPFTVHTRFTMSVEVVASEFCAYVTDEHCIRRITLPKRFFENE